MYVAFCFVWNNGKRRLLLKDVVKKPFHFSPVGFASSDSLVDKYRGHYVVNRFK